jgi:hypothetical protein
MRLSGVTIRTYRPQYRPLFAIRYLKVNPLPTRYTLFISLIYRDAACVRMARPRGNKFREQSTYVALAWKLQSASCVVQGGRWSEMEMVDCFFCKGMEWRDEDI